MYLIRHAESVFNRDNDHLIGGRSNESPLTETGVDQAKNLGRELLKRNIFPTHVHVSPAVRTLMTAEYSLAEIGVSNDFQVHDDLQEMGHGAFEGKNRAETYTPAVIMDLRQQLKDFKLPGGESMNDTGLRMGRWFDANIDPEENARHFVYTHGMAIRCELGRRFGWPPEQIRQNTTPNSSVTLLLPGDYEWQLAYYAYLPKELPDNY